jgi:hypothetical protein
MVGYSQKSEAYRLLDFKTGKFVETKHATFMEENSKSGIGNIVDSEGTVDLMPQLSEEERDDSVELPETKQVDTPKEVTWIDKETANEIETAIPPVTPTSIEVTEEDITDLEAMPGGYKESENVGSDSLLGKVYKYGFGTFFNQEVEDDDLAINDINAPPKYAKRRNHQVNNVQLTHQEEDPLTYDQAMNSRNKKKWVAAMEKELDSLEDNGTWEITSKPTGRSSVSNKWVFKTKRDEEGNIIKHKARLVARGFSQKFGVDFGETYSPVANINSIRIIFSIAAILGWEVHTMDVVAAYLNSEMDYEVFMDQPEGYNDGTGKYCKVKKALYGFHQSGRLWYGTLDTYLTSIGFVMTKSDNCVYVRYSKETPVFFVTVNVDDITMTGGDLEMIKTFKQEMSDRFKMEDRGEVKLHLGLKIRRDFGKHELYLSQPQYIKDVLLRFGMWDCKIATTPMTTSTEREYLKKNETEPTTREPYREAIGALLYASICTRPDIAVAVGFFAKFVSEPTDKHWQGVKRIMRYLRGTWNHELVLGGNTGDVITLSGYADADWAGDNDDRKSRTGYVFYINDGLITWNSKKQPTVAHSSTESEIMAAHSATCEALWIRSLLKELGWEQFKPTVIRDDNTGCIALSKNPINHGRTKHMDVKYHGLRENVLEGNVILEYCPTDKNIADVMTKGLGENAFVKHRENLGVREGNEVELNTSKQERVLNANLCLRVFSRGLACHC